MPRTLLAATILGLCLSVIAPSQATAATRVVDDDGFASASNCNSATGAFTTIQAAVTAAISGDTILVCPGVYAEQVRISGKNLTIRGVKSENGNLALIRPATMIANSTSAYSGNPIAAVVVVEGSPNVTLTNLTVDAANNGIPGCDLGDPVLVGIFYRNASGKVEGAAARNIRLGAGLESCDSGIGIFAQSGTEPPTGSPSKLTVVGSSVHDYQKNGIQGNEAGTELYATGNAVTGDGPTPFITQNGIQVAYGAKGTVANNLVANHAWSLCVDATDCAFVSTNILVFESERVTVTANVVAKSQGNIFMSSNNSEASSNAISDADVWHGILVAGEKNVVLNNQIFNSDEAGVWVLGRWNRIQQNTINDTPCGVFEAPGSSSNTISGNRFFNTQNHRCTAPVTPLSVASVSSPGAGLPQPQPSR